MNGLYNINMILWFLVIIMLSSVLIITVCYKMVISARISIINIIISVYIVIGISRRNHKKSLKMGMEVPYEIQGHNRD